MGGFHLGSAFDSNESFELTLGPQCPLALRGSLGAVLCRCPAGLSITLPKIGHL